MAQPLTVKDIQPVQPEAWDFWPDGAHGPALNMALDEALLESAPARVRPLLRFYRWNGPAMSIGYVQRFPATPRPGFAVVRRPTGGGIVFHDHDFTYSVVIPAAHRLAGLDRLQSYGFINAAVLAGLACCQVTGALATAEIPKSVDRDTMVCFRTPTRYDIMDGKRKIAGSAQRRTRHGILHQGSIHFGGELTVRRDALAQGLLDGFRKAAFAEFAVLAPTAELLARANVLVQERYGTDHWNHRR